MKYAVANVGKITKMDTKKIIDHKQLLKHSEGSAL